MIDPRRLVEALRVVADDAISEGRPAVGEWCRQRATEIEAEREIDLRVGQAISEACGGVNIEDAYLGAAARVAVHELDPE